MAASLKSLGFTVIVGIDLTKTQMDRKILEFRTRTAAAARSHYSGHGLQVAGVNYLVPIDAELTATAAWLTVLREIHERGQHRLASPSPTCRITCTISAGAIASTFGKASLPSIFSVVISSSSPVTAADACANPASASRQSRPTSATCRGKVGLTPVPLCHVPPRPIHSELDGRFDSIPYRAQDKAAPMRRHDLEFAVIDVFPVALGKSVKKNCPVSTLESE